jgi:branched-chain amino acid transport system permease protein
MSRNVKLLGVVAVALLFCLLSELYLDKLIDDSATRQLMMIAAINVMIALSLNIINGMAGQFSIGHAGFVGLGAYTSAVVVSQLHFAFPGPISFSRGLIFVPISLVAAGIVSACFGFLVGLPSLRLKGDYLAIVTLGFSEIFRLLIATASAGPSERGLMALLAKLGGEHGYAGVDDLGVPQYAGPFFVFGMVVVMTVICFRIKFSGWGRALRALREDEIAASAVGVDPTRYKVTSFVLAAMGGGIAGGLLGIMRDGSPIVQPGQFNFQANFDAITMVILGGSGSVSGSIVGAFFVTFSVKAIEFLESIDGVQAFRSEHTWLNLSALRMVLYASALIAVMIWRPGGVFGERELFHSKFRTRGSK